MKNPKLPFKCIVVVGGMQEEKSGEWTCAAFVDIDKSKRKIGAQNLEELTDIELRSAMQCLTTTMTAMFDGLQAEAEKRGLLPPITQQSSFN